MPIDLSAYALRCNDCLDRKLATETSRRDAVVAAHDARSLEPTPAFQRAIGDPALHDELEPFKDAEDFTVTVGADSTTVTCDSCGSTLLKWKRRP